MGVEGVEEVHTHVESQPAVCVDEDEGDAGEAGCWCYNRENVSERILVTSPVC